MRAQLKELLASSSALVLDLMKLFDDDSDASMLIDDVEFQKALRNVFHYGGSPFIVNQVPRPGPNPEPQP